MYGAAKRRQIPQTWEDLRGGGGEGCLRRAPPPSDYAVFGKFGAIVCWNPLEGQRPNYGESWVYPCQSVLRFH